MISKATLADAPDIENLINAAYRGESSKLGWTSEAHLLQGKRTTQNELETLIGDEKNIFLKYVDQNIILGCVLLKINANELYLGMLTVTPKFQNEGIGKKLLQKVDILATELKLSKIVMTVISVRYELINWYERYGFVDSGKRIPFPINNDHTEIIGHALEFTLLEKTT